MSKSSFCKSIPGILKYPATSPFVKVSKVGNAGIVTMDRLKAKNSFGLEGVVSNYTAIRDLESSCKLVIHKSASPVTYSSGGDLVEMAGATVERFACGAPYVYEIQYLVASYKIPYIALISGLAFGGATTFSSTAKYRVATETTSYCAPEVFVGNFLDCGQAYFYSKINQNVARYLALTGAKLTGYDVRKIGLATHFVESKNLGKLENELTKCESEAQVGKVLSDFSTGKPSNHVAHYEQHLDKIERLFSGESVEEIIERLQLDGSAWSAHHLMLMSRASPLSLKVNHKMVEKSYGMSLRECCALQLNVGRRIHDKGDLCEGSRAFFVEKDRNPSWAPNMGPLPFKYAYLLNLKFKYSRNKVLRQTLDKLEALTPDIVDSFFVPYKEGFAPQIDRPAPEIEFKGA